MAPLPDPVDELVHVRDAGPGCVVARVHGELDARVAGALRRRLVAETRPGVTVLVVDLQAVTLLSAAAITMLVDVVHLSAERGVATRLVATSRAVLRPLAITGDDLRLPLYSSPAAAQGA